MSSAVMVTGLRCAFQWTIALRPQWNRIVSEILPMAEFCAMAFAVDNGPLGRSLNNFFMNLIPYPDYGRLVRHSV